MKIEDVKIDDEVRVLSVPSVTGVVTSVERDLVTFVNRNGSTCYAHIANVERVNEEVANED